MTSDDLREQAAAMHEGYRVAQHYGFAAVNLCPYGPAYPDTVETKPLAHAWYRGFWFWEYVCKPWRDAANHQPTE